MQKTVDKGSACCLTTTFRSCEHELERSRRIKTNKKFKLAAMSLATAVAVSAVGPSASAVTYYLGDGSVTVDKDDTRGAYSYQGEDGSEEHRTYVNEDKAETGDGTIYVKDGNAPTGEVPPSTDNSNNGTEETTPTDNDTQSTDASGNNTENSSTSETTTGNTITVMEDVKKKDVQGRWYRRQ